ncbi:zinc ribbon domain-containing protein [Acidicapsa dinghuensis]|uniref:Zinc ribbon domain-containing protein n=1 Tax=Acidicapsa dinghuensis TaxID=2218256 RepID=A0ABW1EMV9_9BACT|nr:zinc ribbon domain-containing protein [Acidicapsa dinghuensis]
MANFCTKCGATLNPDTRFCTRCGAPVESQPIAATGPVYTSSMQPGTVMPAPVPQSSGPSAVKIILIVVAVCVGLGIIGAGIFAFTVWRVAHTIHVSSTGPDGKVTVDTGSGSITASDAQTFTASDLGVDIYPGAQNGHGSLKMDLPTGSMITGVFVTSDPKDKVVAFYKDKLGSQASTFDAGNSAVLSVNKGEHESVMVTVNANSGQDDGKTRISIVHTKSTK